MATAEDDDDLLEACVGRLFFLQPHRQYVPPHYFPRISRREYRWKIGAKVKTSPVVSCKVSHAVDLPNILGLGPEARWRWQWIPISLMTSLVVRIWPHDHSSADVQDMGNLTPRQLEIGVSPRARLKVLTPVFGKFALLPTLELLPTPMLIMGRQFHFGTTKLSLQAHLEIMNTMGVMKWPQCSLQINWHPADTMKVMVQPIKDTFRMQYSRSFNLFPGCKGVATGLADVPMVHSASGLLVTSPLHASLDSFKVSHIITDKAWKSCPLRPSTYLMASKKIGTSDLISVIPGHWIDPGSESGAPGEREFNMDVANMLEKQLTGNGWKVLRPDRESPNLTWEEYLNWVSKQTSQGIPVLEIHGQGSKADYRGFVLGVIGDTNSPLNKELAKDFGIFKMDWTELGVPKRGGAVLESFNSDEVLQMAPWHRKWSVRRLTNRIVKSIECASYSNRVSRGLILDEDSEDEMVAMDENLLNTRQ